MAKSKLFALAGAFLLVSSAAHAADLALPEAPPPEPMPVPVEAVGGWYLRGDLGFSNQEVDGMDNALYSNVTGLRQSVAFDGAPFAGIGVGYQFNQWFRVDVTGEYRAGANFRGRDVFASQFDTDGDPATPGTTLGVGVDTYTAQKSEFTGLINAYFDLGTWNNITPFVGAGVGLSRNTISHFTDIGTNDVNNGTSVAFGGTKSKVNFAWALMAGVGYQVAPGLTLEGAYRYINLGKAETGDMIAFDGTNNINNPTKFKDITSHDLKFGMRWSLGAPAAPSYAEAPLMRKF